MYNVLIVDDEPIVKIALRSIIPWEEHDFSICATASNGSEALTLIEKYRPEIIITDLKMPEMDGLELIRTLKEQEYLGEILVLSNYEDFDSVRNALILGASDYLLKIKIKPDTLLTCLTKTVQKLQRNNTTTKNSPTSQNTDISNLLQDFFQSDLTLNDFIHSHPESDLSFMKDPCALCFITFEKFISNDAFSISKKLLRDMILDVVQGLLQPHIITLSDYLALVILNQNELSCSGIVLEQLLRKLYNRFTMYQSFAPDMPHRENLADYAEARQAYQEFRTTKESYSSDVAKALKYLNEQYMYRITLTSVAEYVNLSPSYLCRIFKTEVGTSITSYLNNLRVRKAASLIRENQLSMKEISSLVGIDDQLYFSRLFKKCMNLSPSEYGKRFHQ